MNTKKEAIWQVSALNFEIKTLLEKGIGSIWIEGEISNFACPASGHWYFSLKDERAQLRAAMFKNKNQRIAFMPENGQQVLIRAQVTLYEARGEFQVIVEHMEEAGIGLLMRQYEALKVKLSKEGLFSESHKQKLPSHAQHIGIVTSPSGAAIRDALSVIKRRSPSTEVTVFPTPVQGQQATASIISAIQQANQHNSCDVILLIRGGGSLEDLWCFNEESLARAIFDSRIPIISGIGHEIDYSIADFVADLRAPTPSVAAEMVSRDQYEIMAQIDSYQLRLARQINIVSQQYQQRLNHSQKQLLNLHPQRQIETIKQRLHHYISRLNSIQTAKLVSNNNLLEHSFTQLKYLNPANKISQLQEQIERLQQKMCITANNNITKKRHQLALQLRSLDSLSPLKTLARGYTSIKKQERIISSSKQLKVNDKIKITFKDGVWISKVLNKQ